tara:strand:- start:2886 stop:3191 length:306 start_codon:yes stop_codon:yes gene_type:complete
MLFPICPYLKDKNKQDIALMPKKIRKIKREYDLIIIAFFVRIKKGIKKTGPAKNRNSIIVSIATVELKNLTILKLHTKNKLVVVKIRGDLYECDIKKVYHI